MTQMPRSASASATSATNWRGMLEVVEHGDARDRLGLLVWPALCQRPCGVEVVDDVISLGDGVSRDIGRVEAQVAKPLRAIAVQQRAVVAADVDDQVSRLQRCDRFDSPRNSMEVLGHRAVDPAAIPVGAVEDRTGDRVLGLDQATRFLVARHVAAHELERDCPLDRLVAAGIGKRPRDALVAQ